MMADGRPSAKAVIRRQFHIGAKVVSHGRYVAFQMAKVAIPRQMFQDILRLVAQLRASGPARGIEVVAAK